MTIRRCPNLCCEHDERIIPSLFSSLLQSHMTKEEIGYFFFGRQCKVTEVGNSVPPAREEQRDECLEAKMRAQQYHSVCAVDGSHRLLLVLYFCRIQNIPVPPPYVFLILFPIVCLPSPPPQAIILHSFTKCIHEVRTPIILFLSKKIFLLIL